MTDEVQKKYEQTDLFVADLHHQKLDRLGNPLTRIGACYTDFVVLRQIEWVDPEPM